MNFTFHKASSQISVDIDSFEKDDCKSSQCDYIGKDVYQNFKIDFAVSNLGFTAGANILIDVTALNQLEIIRVFDSNAQEVASDSKKFDLSVGNLSPLESRKFTMYARIP